MAPARAPRGPAPGPGRAGPARRGDTTIRNDRIDRAVGNRKCGRKFVGSRNYTASAGRRRVYTGEKCSFCAKVALRTLCLRALPVLRTPLGPPSPVYSMPNIEHAMPAGAFVESCVSAFARRSSVGG